MAKDKTRTEPSSVRWDKEKLEFIMTKERLSSKQQVIDLLVNKYWWEHKMPAPTHKESPPLHLRQEQKQQSIAHITPPELSLFDDYTIQLKDARMPSEMELIMKTIKLDPNLTPRDKAMLETHAKDLSRTMYND